MVAKARSPTNSPATPAMLAAMAREAAQAEARAKGASPSSAGRPLLSWRGLLRLTATLSNTAMIVYVYVAHLATVEWQHFGRLQAGLPAQGTARGLAVEPRGSIGEHLAHWDFDSAFEHLRLLTFSQAMLENLAVYVVVGTPVAMVLFALERDRIRWLQALISENLPESQAVSAVRWLEVYLWVLGATLLFVLGVGPCHIDLPWAHYACTFCALGCGCLSMALYLFAPVDLSALATAAGREDIDAWAQRAQRWERPCLKLVLGLHGLALAAGVWKAQNLHDDRAALLFGVLETSLILGYQLFPSIFVIDDVMVTPRKVGGGGATEKLLLQ